MYIYTHKTGTGDDEGGGDEQPHAQQRKQRGERHLCVHMHIHTHVCMHACMHACMHIHHKYISICIYIHTYVCVYTYMYICVCIYIYTYTYLSMNIIEKQIDTPVAYKAQTSSKLHTNEQSNAHKRVVSCVPRPRSAGTKRRGSARKKRRK